MPDPSASLSPKLQAISDPWRWHAIWGATLMAASGAAATRIHSAWASDGGSGGHELYKVLVVVFMMIGGLLADLYGLRRLGMLTLAGLTITGVLGLLLGGVEQARPAIEMAGAALGGASLTLAMATVRMSLPEQALSLGIALYMVGYGVGLAVIPLLSRLLQDPFGIGAWFWPLALLAALALDGVSVHLPSDPPIRRDAGSVLGIVVFVFSVGALAMSAFYAASGTARDAALAWLSASAVALAVFLWWESRLPVPALDVRQFGRAWFLAALLAGAAVSFGLGTSYRSLPALIGGLLGTMDKRGLAVLVVSGLIAAGAGALASARLTPRINNGRLLASGIAVMGVGLIGVAFTLMLRVNYLWLSVPIAALAGGLVLAMLVRTTVLISTVPTRSAGAIAALTNSSSYLGGSFAVAVTVPLLTRASMAAYAESLSAAGVDPATVGGATASLSAAVASVAALYQSAAPTSTTTAATTALQESLELGVAVVAISAGALLLACAVPVWLSWRSRVAPPPVGSTALLGGPPIKDTTSRTPKEVRSDY